MRTRALLLLLPVLIVAAPRAFACTPAPQLIRTYCTVREDIFHEGMVCLDPDCYLKAKGFKTYAEIEGGSLAPTIELAPTSITVFEPGSNESVLQYLQVDALLCREDFASDEAAVLRAVQTFLAQGRRYFLDGSIQIEPYSDDRQRDLKGQSYLHCGYAAYQRAGNWLVSWDTTRPYCHLSNLTLAGMCPAAVFSIGSFVIFLVTHINSSTTPYLLLFLVVIGAVAALLIYLQRRNDLGRFFEPNRFNVLATCALTATIGCLVGIDFLFEWIIPSYLVTSALWYFSHGRNLPGPNAGAQ